MRKNNVKNTTIKAALVLGAALAFAAPAAAMFQTEDVMAFGFSFTSSSTTSNSETSHGITKTTTTSTVNGVTEETVEYTDEDGNVLDQEIGEQAFAAAKSGVEDPLAYVMGETEELEKVTDATFVFDNQTDFDISGLYMAVNDSEDWGDNFLPEDSVWTVDTTATMQECMYYNPNLLFQIAIVPEDGEAIIFDEISLANCDDPQNVTFTFTEEDGCCYITID